MAQQKSKAIELILPKSWADFINANIIANIPQWVITPDAIDATALAIFHFAKLVGVPGADIIENNLMPLKIPEAPEIVETYLKGFLSDVQFKQIMRWHGIDISNFDTDQMYYTMTNGKQLDVNPDFKWNLSQNWNNVWVAKTEVPGFAETLVMLNRGLITKDLAAQWLTMMKFADPAIIHTLLDLRYEIPPNSDLIRWAVRHAFDTDIVEQFGYRDEVPIDLYKYSEANGLGGPTGVQYPAGKDNKGNAVPAGEAKWFDMEWTAHWILPSTGQGYDMLHRLYAASQYGMSPDATKNTSFSIDQLKTLLRAQDVPPFWRDRLIAISYNPYSRVDVRRMYQANIIQDADVYHSYRAQGYDDTKAKNLLKFAQYQKDQLLVTKYGKQLIKANCQAYNVGIIDDAALRESVASVIDDPQEQAVIVSNCEYEASIKHTETIVKAIRVQMVKGVIDVDTARQMLTNQGIVNARVSLYIEEWQLSMNNVHKAVSAAEVIKWMKSNIIDSGTAFQRLLNMGYDQSDASAIVRIAIQEMDHAANKQALADARVQQQKDKQQSSMASKEQGKMQKAIAQTAKAAATAAKALVKGIGEAKLKAWYVNSEISLAQLNAYLTLLGWTASTIDLFIQELNREIDVGILIPGPGKTPTVAKE